MAGTLELRMHPGMHHGWLEAPLSLLSELGIEDLVSEHSRCKDGKVYLEDDVDAYLVIHRLQRRDTTFMINFLPPSGENGIEQLPNYPVRPWPLRMLRRSA